MMSEPMSTNHRDFLTRLDARAPHAVAEALALLGIPVFPLHTIDDQSQCSCGGSCGPNAGKHPRTSNGFYDATCDVVRVDAWWTTWPEANIGVATGAGAGIWVLDIDPDHGGDVTLAALEAECGELEPTWCVETGGGGFHLWHRYPKWDLRNSVGLLGPGIDVRAEGGYVIVPPSRHRSGGAYQWAMTRHPTAVAIADAPKWLLERLEQGTRRPMIPPDRTAYPQGTGGTHSQVPSLPIPDGQRNATLARLAGSMRHSGLSEGAILAALLVENAARCVPPLPEVEVATIARSIARYAPAAVLRRLDGRPRPRGFVEFIDGKAVVR